MAVSYLNDSITAFLINVTLASKSSTTMVAPAVVPALSYFRDGSFCPAAGRGKPTAIASSN